MQQFKESGNRIVNNGIRAVVVIACSLALISQCNRSQSNPPTTSDRRTPQAAAAMRNGTAGPGSETFVIRRGGAAHSVRPPNGYDVSVREDGLIKMRDPDGNEYLDAPDIHQRTPTAKRAGEYRFWVPP